MDSEVGPRPGRKRDVAREEAILDAALDLLAELGWSGLTLDAVAARAQAGKATMYRRWPSKTHLVHDAVVRMSRRDVDLSGVPDTGSLRRDVLGSSRPDAYGEQRVRIMRGLLSMAASDPTGLGASALRACVRPWVQLNRRLLDRAVARGEIPDGLDLDLIAQVVPSMCLYRVSVDQVALDPPFVEALIDGVLLPLVGLSVSDPASGDGDRRTEGVKRRQVRPPSTSEERER